MLRVPQKNTSFTVELCGGPLALDGSVLQRTASGRHPAGKSPSFVRVLGRVPLMVGSKRTLVFYLGRPPTDQRTHWVMQEYCLAGVCLSPYRVVRPCTSTNNNLCPLCQSSSNADAVGKVVYLYVNILHVMLRE
ncbi:hypothetical protein PR202_gb12934 [Eleusine coracana subsp. coracana]|uniref:NAC domain-containing protein n=1 Tax=Eleusine coracana subsp. coracana TaxID=191504 RepID=A0AAV5EQW6_ELECO|nr:hypothetical protein PR202_gb12934 [Eleusine coracana subsp. coracana]